MRILHISTRLIIGGSQENTVLSCIGHAERRARGDAYIGGLRQHGVVDADVAEGSRDRGLLSNGGGHDVHLAFGPIYGPEGSMLPRLEAWNAGHAHCPIRLHEVPHLVREVSPRADVRAYGELKRLIERIEPDVVHTHSSKAGVLGRCAAWAAGGRVGRRAVIHTVHGPPFHAHVSRLQRLVYVGAERAAAKRCHAIVSVADAMTSLFVGHGIGERGLFTTVRSGMELGPYLEVEAGEEVARRRAALGFGPGDVVIGTVARLAALKGHEDLVQALGPLLRGDDRLRLLWVGDGWLRERLEGLLAAAGVRDRVVITGMVDPGEVPKLLRCMDVLVHPSYREGLPRAVVQGLLRGVPVVATDADGTREVVEDGVTGRLVGVGDVVGLREAVGWMLADGARAARTAEVGRGRCVEAFDWRLMVDRLEAVYAAALLRGRLG